MSSLRLGTRLGGEQAPRREALIRLPFGAIEVAATLVSLLALGLTAYLVGYLGLTTPEALTRTAQLGTLWHGFQTDLAAFGFDRPPLTRLLAIPFAAFEGLHADGLAGALGTALAAGLGVAAAGGLARSAGLTRPAAAMFTAAFALNPLLVYAGVFGLSEGIYAALMLIALGQFGLWMQRESVAGIIGAGVALGLAFLVRYNAILVALAMGWAFWFVARGEAGRRRDAESAMATTLAFAVPIVFMAGLWTLLAWFAHGDVFEYLGRAREITRLGANDPAIIERVSDFQGAPLAVLAWVGGWALVLAPASVLAILALAAQATWRRSRRDWALVLLSLALVLPEVVALVLGLGHARVHHLFVAVVPAFAILAFRERHLTGGLAPTEDEPSRRRAQLAWTAALALASFASAAALTLFPPSEAPASQLEQTVRSGVVTPMTDPEAREIAAYIRDVAGPGGVLVDIDRHAEVMLLVGDISRFRTDASEGGDAILYEPLGFATHILARRPLDGQGPGRIERAYPALFEDGAPNLTLEAETPQYRLYAVTGPALP